jgi:hypothetical protein
MTRLDPVVVTRRADVEDMHPQRDRIRISETNQYHLYARLDVEVEGLTPTEAAIMRHGLEIYASQMLTMISLDPSAKGPDATEAIADALYTQLQFKLPENLRHHVKLELIVRDGVRTVRATGPGNFIMQEPLSIFPTDALVNRMLCLV